MRNLPNLLVQVAATVIAMSHAGCSTKMVGSCDGAPTPRTITVGEDVACAIATSPQRAGGTSSIFRNDACTAACKDVPSADTCTLPPEYAVFNSAPPEPPGLGSDAGPVDAAAPSIPGCPTGAQPSKAVSITCSPPICMGRRTAGAPDAWSRDRLAIGEYFAECARLEQIAVYAFARLARELEAHGAPRELVDDAVRAQDDEVRHARVTTDIARRFGASPPPVECAELAPRSLFAIALENAVEGCVRETFGAAFGLVHAERVDDPALRAELAAVARDECEHADLSWRVAEWALPRLSAGERAEIDRQMRAAVRDLARSFEADDDAPPPCGLPSAADRRRILALLDARLFRIAA